MPLNILERQNRGSKTLPCVKAAPVLMQSSMPKAAIPKELELPR
jgi:hypothetical protein